MVKSCKVIGSRVSHGGRDGTGSRYQVYVDVRLEPLSVIDCGVSGAACSCGGRGVWVRAAIDCCADGGFRPTLSISAEETPL